MCQNSDFNSMVVSRIRARVKLGTLCILLAFVVISLVVENSVTSKSIQGPVYQNGNEEVQKGFELFPTLDHPHKLQSERLFLQQDSTHDENVNLLLSRLDLENPELSRVRLISRNGDVAIEKLLQYYRSRKSVGHPVKRKGDSASADIQLDEKELKIANDALQHIFVGQPAYPPHFCGNDIDWSTNPVKDKEWVWQLNRMYFWDAMAHAYAATGDERYAEEWCNQVQDWVLKNPNDVDHKYAWRSIEAGIRGYRWTGLFQYFIDSPHFTPEVLVSFLNSCYDHANYLMTQYRSGSNWGLMEAEGMAFIAITFPEFKDALKWRQEAFERLNREIEIQVYSDGHQRELAMGYHIGCIRWFYRTYELARLNGLDQAFPDSYLQRIEKMCEVPMKIGLPDGTNAQFGDAWAGSPGQYRDLFLSWADIFDRDDFLYMATNGQRGHAPAQTAYALKESGLYSMRSGWHAKAICLVLKCGPDGGGHCQPDNGTFALYAGGRNLMPDAGSYIYSGDPAGRAWFRQTKVHQTLTLDERNSAYHPKLITWSPSDSLDILVVENAGFEDLVHRRSVFFVEKRYFVIIDEAMGVANGNIGLHFQLAPGEFVMDSDRKMVSTRFAKGWNLSVQAVDQQGLTLMEEEGWVSFTYTRKEPRPAFKYNIYKGSSQQHVRFITLVLPFIDEQPQVAIRISESTDHETPSILEIEEHGNRKNLFIKSKYQ